MKKTIRWLVTLSLAFSFCGASRALFAGDGDEPNADLQVIYWPFSMGGSGSIRGTSSDIDRRINPLGVVVAGERRLDNWGLNMDFFWGRNTNDGKTANGDDVDFLGEYFVGTFAAYLNLIDKDSMENDKRFVLDGFLGFRGYLNSYKFEIHTNPETVESDYRNWVDPVVGARMTYTFTPKWAAELYGDVGGFGIGAASKLSVSAHAAAKWMVSSDVAVTGGYRLFTLESEHQNGDNQTQLNLRLSGPTVGVDFKF